MSTDSRNRPLRKGEMLAKSGGGVAARSIKELIEILKVWFRKLLDRCITCS
jgi:hypothetical protein